MATMTADPNILSLFSRLGLSKSLANNLGLGTQPMPGGGTAGSAINPQMSLSTALSPLTVDQSKLPQLGQNYNYNDLANFEDQYYNQYQNQLGSVLDQRRSALSSDLNNQGKSLFDLANPGILEDLNSRGLFTSPTAVANSQSNALKEIGLQNNQYLNQFDNQALATQLQAAQNAMDSGLNIRESGLAANLQQGQLNQEDQLARDLANKQSRNSLINSLIGAGGSIGSGLLYSSLAHGGTSALSGIPGLQGGAALSGGNIAGQGGIGAFGTGGALHAFGPAAGIGAALAIRNGMDKGTFGNLGNSAIKIAQPFFAPDKTLKSLGSRVSNAFGGSTHNVVGNVTKPFTGTVNEGKKLISNVFCFDGMTPIKMSDGSVKPICEMDLDDETKGGSVVSIRISKTADGTLFNYLGETVTGSHAVKENGAWVRVKDSAYAAPMRGSGIVYAIVTSGHRIYVNDTTFADEHETDQYETLTMDQSLAELNRQDELERVN